MSTSSDFVAQIQSDSLHRLEAIAEMQRQLIGLSGQATSADGWVRVRVTSAGALTDLSIDERGQRGDQLAATILHLTATATAEVGERVRAIVGSVLPADDLEALMSGEVPASTRAEVDAELTRRQGGR